MILNLSLIPTNGLPVIITKPGGGHPNASTLAVHPPRSRSSLLRRHTRTPAAAVDTARPGRLRRAR